MNKNNFWAKDDICNKLFDDPETKLLLEEIKVLDDKLKIQGHIIAAVKKIVVKIKI